MLTWFKEFLWNESTFERVIRSVVMALSLLVAQGELSTGNSKVDKWLSVLGAAGSLMIPAGQKNPKEN